MKLTKKCARLLSVTALLCLTGCAMNLKVQGWYVCDGYLSKSSDCSR
jgi:hypothetical protein